MKPALFTCLAIAALTAQEVSQSGLRLEAARPMVSQPERARTAMIASVHELATQAGLDILKQGGNAIDAAVAVGFALAVVHPEAGNLGGGGYLLASMADGRRLAVDYKETAPASATPDMYSGRAPASGQASVSTMDQRVGYRASAIPGTPAGLAMAHQRLGKLPWRAVIEPARRLAKDGFPASQRLELILKLQVPVMKQFPESAKVFLHGGVEPLKQGEILKQPDLAATLARIQKNGAREFYEGRTAELIAADMKANGGTITLADLRGYKAIERTPVEGTYRGFGVVSMPPSSSGGTTIIQMLNILEQFPLAPGEEGSSRTRHLMVEAMRRAFLDRARHMADPAFTNVPVGRLISKEYAKELAQSIRLDAATPGDSSAGPSGNESAETTHFSVIDGDGNIVSNTYTLNGFFGSQVIAKGTGVLLNDIMAGFSTRGVNQIAPGKRPLSSMSPTIVQGKDGKPWVALGSPGSATIPNTVMQVIVNMVDFKMSLRDAIEYPRIHHQHSPDRIEVEPGALVTDVAERLKTLGHRVHAPARSQGDVHAVAVEEKTGWRIGWSDGRRGGRAMGY